MSLLAAGSDSAGRSYFLAAGDTMQVHELPWGSAQFDSLVFVDASVPESEVDRTLRQLVSANTGWIYTAGSRPEFWHDRVDLLSVEIGRQQQVGDGSPMTAWFDDLQSLSEWDSSRSFGDSDYFLFVVVGSKEPLDSLAVSLRTADV
jgi:hypothetical protein